MGFELKKLLRCRETGILFGAAVFFLCFSILRLEKPRFAGLYRKEIAHYFAPYQEIRAQLEKDIEEAAKNNTGEGTPGWAAYTVLSELERSARYYDILLEERKEMLVGIRKKLEASPTRYIQKDLQKAYNMYNKRYSFHVINQSEVTIAFLEAQIKVYDYLYIFFLLAFFCRLFLREMETKMYLVLFSSRKGRAALFLEKLGAAVIFLMFFALFFTIVPFVGIWMQNGISFRIFLEPLQSVEQIFKFCPYAVTIWQFVLLACFMRFLAGLLAFSILMICSVCLGKSLQVFMVSSICSAVLMAFHAKEGKPSVIMRTSYKLGGFQLLNPCDYFLKYDTVNMFGIPVTCLTVAIVFTIVFSCFLLVVSYGLYVRPLQKGRRLCY